MKIRATISKSYLANETSLVQAIKYLKENFDCKITLLNIVDKGITVEKIRKVVCNYFGLTPQMLDSNCRKREIVQARQLAHYFSMEYTTETLASTGAMIGGKDHSTVLHSIKMVNDYSDTDRQFREMVSQLEKML